jgi:glycolate oxidase
MPKQALYHPVTAAVVAELRTIVGVSNLLYGEPERMLDYAHDETHGAQYTHMPEVVVKPDGASEISGILCLANRERIPVTPRGAGSGLSGGAVPALGGIVLSLERMNRILEIDPENLVVVVEPGVVTNDINEAVRRHDLFYAGYPMSVETCFIGGNVAENAGGGRAIKYGVTGRYVLGLEVVLPTGEIVELGGKRLKDVTGYDLLGARRQAAEGCHRLRPAALDGWVGGDARHLHAYHTAPAPVAISAFGAAGPLQRCSQRSRRRAAHDRPGAHHPCLN